MTKVLLYRALLASDKSTGVTISRCQIFSDAIERHVIYNVIQVCQSEWIFHLNVITARTGDGKHYKTSFIYVMCQGVNLCVC